MQYDDMRKMELSHVCAECGHPLVTVWDKAANDYRLVCAENREHQGYKAYVTPERQLKRGEKPETEKAVDRRLQDEKDWRPQELKADLQTGKALAPFQVTQLVAWGEKLGLKPFYGHVALMYGIPYPTIDGYYYLAHKRQQVILVTTRPATPPEREMAKVGDFDHYWIAEAIVDGKATGVTGIGIVTQSEVEALLAEHPESTKKLPIYKNPQRQAEKRAEWQVMRKLIPLTEEEEESK